MPIVVNTGSSTPPVTPPPVPSYIATDLLSLTWTGWNGDTWDVQGNHLSKATMERYGRYGFGMPPVQHFFTESATTDGAVWNGYRVPGRPFGFPVFVTGSSPTEARAEQAKFMATLRPEKIGTLTVADPSGARRYIDLRYMGGADEEFESSDYALYWYSHKLQMLAEQPYYYADPIVLTFDSEDPVNFYGGGVGTQAPMFYINSSQTTGNAVVTNPGDVDAWPVWKLFGPFTSAVLSVGGVQIVYSEAVTSTHWVEIDTNPKRLTVVNDAGVNKFAKATTLNTAPIPFSASTPLALTLNGSDPTTKVEVAFTPNFWRAW